MAIASLVKNLTHGLQKFHSHAQLLVAPYSPLSGSLDLERLKLYSHVTPEEDSVLQELGRRILWHWRREPVAKLIQATLIKLRDVNGA
jgi:hypothetical protein